MVQLIPSEDHGCRKDIPFVSCHSWALIPAHPTCPLERALIMAPLEAHCRGLHAYIHNTCMYTHT